MTDAPGTLRITCDALGQASISVLDPRGEWVRVHGVTGAIVQITPTGITATLTCLHPKLDLWIPPDMLTRWPSDA